MGKHTRSTHEGVAIVAVSEAPKPGSRRAALMAERAARLERFEKEAAQIQASLAELDTKVAQAQRHAHSTVAQREEEEVQAIAAKLPSTDAVPLSLADPEITLGEQGLEAHARQRSFFRIKKLRTTGAAFVVLVSAAAGIGMSPSIVAGASQQATLSTATQAEPKLGVDLTITADGATRTLTTAAPNLATALKEAGISVDSNDKLSTSLYTPLREGMKVTIVRVDVKQVSEEVEEAYQSTTVEDPNLPQGQREVQQPGSNGIVSNTYNVTYEDGVEVSRDLAMSTTVAERVDEIVKIGTKAPTPSAQAASDAGASLTGPAVPAGDAQQIAAGMLSSYGWSSDQFSCLQKLWQRESGWNYQAQNRSSGAYGIPQALPGSKMASAGADWRTNPATQIKWGLGYISGRYGSPCGALAHSNAKGWY